MKLLSMIATAVVLISARAFGSDYTYHTQYADQMGTEAPAARNLTEANSAAAGGAVYANRTTSEFAPVAYNWAPSSTPFSFSRGAVAALPPKVHAHLEASNTDGYIVVKDGAIIHEYYAKGMHPTTKHSIHSTGKS